MFLVNYFNSLKFQMTRTALGKKLNRTIKRVAAKHRKIKEELLEHKIKEEMARKVLTSLIRNLPAKFVRRHFPRSNH